MMRTIPILAPALALALSAAIAPAAADSGDVQPIVDVGSGALLGDAADGDGVMEIVVEDGYYEGGGVGVFTVEGGAPKLVLHEGRGA